MTSRFQLARLQIFIGDVASAKQTVNEMLNLQYDHDDKTWYLQVKILIAERQYEKALPLAIWGIKEYAKTGDNNSANFFHLSLVESEIRNYLKDYQSAYDIAAELNRLNKENMSNPTITKGRILIQLARAEYGLGNIKKALQDIEIAISSLLQNPITLLIEKDLADAYSVKADILSLAKKKGDEALQMYDKAESLYYNLYRGNIRNMQNVADVYSNAAKVSCVVGDNKSHRRFFSKLKKYFGSKNTLTLEVADFCKTKYQE
jgi:tetratricopeptide (TPR) repeat protein